MLDNLSIITICKNELRHLDRFIAAHINIASEVIIIDTGSTDGTWEKLQEYSREYKNLKIDRILIHPFRFDYGFNYATARITRDYFVILGMDEVIENISENDLETVGNSAGGYVNYDTDICHETTENFSINGMTKFRILVYMRLIKTSEFIKFQGKIHERTFTRQRPVYIPTNIVINHCPIGNKNTRRYSPFILDKTIYRSDRYYLLLIYHFTSNNFKKCLYYLELMDNKYLTNDWIFIFRKMIRIICYEKLGDINNMKQSCLALKQFNKTDLFIEHFVADKMKKPPKIEGKEWEFVKFIDD